jgi:hypothetical protein
MFHQGPTRKSGWDPLYGAAFGSSSTNCDYSSCARYGTEREFCFPRPERASVKGNAANWR